MKQIVIILCSMWLAGSLLAQEDTIQFTCHAPDTVPPNASFQITFKLENAKGKGLDIGEWVGLQQENGPFTSSSFMSINGKTSQSESFSYTVRATEEGSYFIPSATIYVDEKPYKTEPKKIVVEEGAKLPQRTRSPFSNDGGWGDFFKERPVPKTAPSQKQGKKRKVYRI